MDNQGAVKPLLHKEKKIRKKSRQLSLLDWIYKDCKHQSCKIAGLPKNMIVNIYSYLNVVDILSASQSCEYFQHCAKSVWNSSDFFGELDTSKLSLREFKILIRKSSRLSHIKHIKSIYKGKNLRACREKIKFKVFNRTDHNLSTMYGNLLEVFEISPNIHKPSAFLLDNHFHQIINSSYRSLLTVKLHSCLHVRKFEELSKCSSLMCLEITGNPFFSNKDLKKICQRCLGIKKLDLSGCSNLDQELLTHIAQLSELETLTLKNFNQPLGETKYLHNLTHLTELNLEKSCVLDQELIALAKAIPWLKKVNLSGCQLITDHVLRFLNSQQIWAEAELIVERTKLSAQEIEMFQNRNKIQS